MSDELLYSCKETAKVNKEATCVVCADMLGSTKFWSDVFHGNDENALSDAWDLLSEAQNIVLRVMLQGGNGQFVKGVGDELIFRFREVKNAYDRARDAYSAVAPEIRKKVPNPEFKGFRFV